MELLKLDIQMFSDGKIVIDTQLDTKNFEKGLNTIQGKAKSGGSAIKSIVAGLGITKLIGAAFNTISNSMDTAIKRMDTMNNFPNVMKNLGISAEASQKSIDKMSEKLLGLPTTLDAGAMAVQRFTSKNNDVAKSTDMFLALNNALLAGGASAEIQSSALEQISQAYAKGKPDMIEWRSLLTAMPAQANQLGKAFGMTSEELGEALRKGDISMDEFMEKVMELNEKGVEGFENFEVQARNATGGVATSMANLKARVAAGIADVMNAFNVRLENTAFGTLPQMISDSGTKIKNALGLVASLIKGDISATDFGKQVGAVVAKTLKQISDELPKFLDMAIKVILEIIKGFVESAPQMIDSFIALILGLVDVIIDNLDEFIDAAIKIILALVDGITKNIDKIINATFKIINAIITKLTDQETMDKLARAALKIIVALGAAIIRNIPTIIANTGQLRDKIRQTIEELPGKMWDIGKNIVQGIWNGIKAKKDELIQKVKNFGSSIINSLKAKLGIHSPSTVFRDEVGKMIAAGIGVGFEEGIDDVYKDMQDAIDFETSKMSANVQSSGTYQMAMSDIPTFNLNDNTTNQTQLVVDGKVLAEVVNTENRNREVAKA